ncbi:MAG: 2-C-methyl-D-erythritol 2,4-cyclodiphosphate synthase [Candidatus Hydrogenedentes bacterium]|nr:2-C-methyl-D-erythritol 2,4-cyclodiphosphate synthase [Candidatus Hydrogenedentota bacterium]
MRVGQGYDLHRLEPGRPLILGGVKVPYDKGLAGHSDADVLAHAITDALLGAVALGNIGEHFPDTDPQYKGANSLQLLQKAYLMVTEAGYHLGNIDATIIAQEPRLNPHILSIRKSLAECLSVPVETISVKAKTLEGLGPEGRSEAISVHACVLVVPIEG